MVEPLNTAATVVALVGNALVLSQQVYSKANDISNAPKHIKAISMDLEDFYTILGTLKGYLDDDDLSSGVSHHATSENLEMALKNSITIFKDISKALALYNPRDGSGKISQWRKIEFSFMKDEIEALRNSLAANKLTLNMAISVANFLNLRAVNETAGRIEAEISVHIRELEEKLPIISQQLEDVQAASIPPGQTPSLNIRNSILLDYGFTMRRYLDIAASIKESTIGPPSMQISTLEPDGSCSVVNSSAFQTAPTQIAADAASNNPWGLTREIRIQQHNRGAWELSPKLLPKMKRQPLTPIPHHFFGNQIFVKGLTKASLAIELDCNMSVEQLKDTLSNRMGSGPSLKQSYQTFLVHAGTVLQDERCLSHYNIIAGATIFWNVRAQGSGGLVIVEGIYPSVWLDGISLNHSIAKIKKLIAEASHVHVGNNHLEYEDEILDDDKCLGDYRYTGWSGALTMHLRTTYDESLDSNWGSYSSSRTIRGIRSSIYWNVRQSLYRCHGTIKNFTKNS